MKTFEQCCREAAQKLDIKKMPMHPCDVQLVTEAAELYANEKLKWLLEEVNVFAQVFEQKSESAEDEGQGCNLSGRAASYREIASRIEELLNQTK